MEYTIFINRPSVGRWRATAPALPDCVAEAPNREQVLMAIRERIAAITVQTEMLRISMPTSPQDAGRWDLFGAFSDDPTVDELYEQIERERDAHLA